MKKYIPATLIILFIFISSCTVPQNTEDEADATIQPDLPATVAVLPVKAPIKVDGELNEEIYAYAPRYEMQNSQTGEVIDNPAYLTHVQIIHDDTYLYIAYTCLDQDIHNKFTERDEHLWEEEVVEVFIDVDEVAENYVEIEVSPTNVLFDSFIVDPDDIDVPETAAYDLVGIQTGVNAVGTVNNRADMDSLWTVEIAVPFDELVSNFSPEDIPGYEWKINFYRLNRDDYGPRAMAYSPTQGSFHKPERFVALTFLPGTYATYQVNKAQTSLNVDGTGEDPAWDLAESLTNFRFPWQERTTPDTEFRALWDEEQLYFQFVVKDEDIVLVDRENNDRSVTGSDRVELFFAANEILEPYYCLEMDPRTQVFDAKGMLYRKIDATWNWEGLETYATIGEDGYILEGKIPIQSFEKLELWQNEDKTLLKTGVFRAEFTQRDDEIEQNWISWIQPDNPTPDFHIPSAFGYFELNR